MTHDDDCGCGKVPARKPVRSAGVAHTHHFDPSPARGITPADLQAKLEGRNWKADAAVLKSADGKRRVTVWRRPPLKGGMTFNDTLVALEIDGEVQLFRLSEVRPLDMILSGKAPPA